MTSEETKVLIQQIRKIASRGRMDDADVQIIFDAADELEDLLDGYETLREETFGRVDAETRAAFSEVISTLMNPPVVYTVTEVLLDHDDYPLGQGRTLLVTADKSKAVALLSTDGFVSYGSEYSGTKRRPSGNGLISRKITTLKVDGDD